MTSHWCGLPIRLRNPLCNTLIMLVSLAVASWGCNGNSSGLAIPDGNSSLGRWGEDANRGIDNTGADVRQTDLKTPETVVEPACHSNLPEAAVRTYFTKPCRQPDHCPCSPIDLGKIVKSILDEAQESVDICTMELQDFTVSKAVIAAHKRGVSVRLALDDNYDEAAENKAVSNLLDEGLTPHSDSPSGLLMHSKFIVVDSAKVLISSANLTTYDHRSNANNLLVLHSPELATIFQTRFEAMWQNGKYHSITSPGPYTATVDGSTIEVLFGPHWALPERLVEAIYAAEKSIHFNIFSFTLGEVKEAILDRCGDLEIRGVYDGDQSDDNNSVVVGGWCAGADIRKADVPLTPGVDPDFGFRKLHHKVLIIDPGESTGLVITGSANWSYSAATKNDEVMVTFEHPEVVSAFEEEFQARFKEAD
jgi:phosphatidylserine/phosphatidylglycerophosphate/cardiolipin synthase-like enzyme